MPGWLFSLKSGIFQVETIYSLKLMCQKQRYAGSVSLHDCQRKIVQQQKNVVWADESCFCCTLIGAEPSPACVLRVSYTSDQLPEFHTLTFNRCSAFVLSVLQPPVLLSNLTDCTVNASSSVILSCPSQGVPPPTVKWYKDERPLHQGSGKNKHSKCISCCDLVSKSVYPFNRQVSSYQQEMGASILTESQWRTGVCILVWSPMRGVLQRALPTYGSTVSTACVPAAET